MSATSDLSRPVLRTDLRPVRSAPLSAPPPSGRPVALRRIASTVVVGSLGLLLAACGTSGTAATTGPAATATSPPAATSAPSTAPSVSPEHGPADVQFIDDMTPHHSGALAMARLAASRAGSPQVRDLAARIAAAQAPEQELMAAMARAWGVPVPAVGDATGHGQPSGSPMASPGADHMTPPGAPATGPSTGMGTTALEPLTGAAFDRMFLTMMIEHHSGALPMARAELASGVNPQAKDLASAVISAQTTEIDEMRRVLAAG